MVTEKTFAAITPTGGVMTWGEVEIPGLFYRRMLVSGMTNLRDERILLKSYEEFSLDISNQFLFDVCESFERCTSSCR